MGVYHFTMGMISAWKLTQTKLNELVALWVSMFRGSNKGVGMYQVGSKHKSFT